MQGSPISVRSLLTLEGVVSLISNSVCAKSISNILGEIKSKNSLVRGRVAEYVSIMLETYPDDVLDKHASTFSKGKNDS